MKMLLNLFGSSQRRLAIGAALLLQCAPLRAVASVLWGA
jgi:hypothetical protein